MVPSVFNKSPTIVQGVVTLTNGQGNVANVVIHFGDHTVSPNADGQYSLEIPAGTYEVTASLAGYESYVAHNVQVTAGETTTLNISLVQSPTIVQGVVTLVNGQGNVANVVIHFGDHTVSPNAAGQYSLEIPAGTYEVTASLEGYDSFVAHNVQVTAGETTTLNISLTYTVATDDPVIPVKSMITNFPNPFNPSTVIRYDLPESEIVHINIYNAKGQKVNTLVNEFKNAGHHSIMWNGLDANGKTVTSGIYYSVLKTTKATITNKMLLIK